MKTRISAALALILVLSAVTAAPVAAKGPGTVRTADQIVAAISAAPDPQRAFDALVEAEKDVVRAGSAIAAVTLEEGGSGSIQSAAITPLAIRCYYAYWIAEAKNAVGVVLFQYKEQVDWCSDGTKITSVDRWTMPITPKPWIWRFDGETLFSLTYNTTKSQVTARARGDFTQLLPPLGIEVGASHPMVTIYAKANGTATGSISW